MNNCGDTRREYAEGSGSKLRSNDVSRDRRGHEYQPAPEKELAPNEAKGHAKDGSTRKGINAGNHDGEVRVDARIVLLGSARSCALPKAFRCCRGGREASASSREW